MKRKILSVLLCLAAAASAVTGTGVFAAGKTQFRMEAEDTAGTGSVSAIDGCKQLMKSSPMIFEYNCSDDNYYDIKVVATASFNKNINLYVNGELKKSNILPNIWTASVNNIKTVDCGFFALTKGVNEIKLESNDNNVYVDAIIIENMEKFEPADGVLRLEAEDYAVSPVYDKDFSDAAAAAGNKYVTNTAVSYKFNASAGKYILNIAGANYFGAQTAVVSVNGTEQEVNISEGPWSTQLKTTNIKNYKIAVDLREGENTIEIAAKSNLCIDYIELTDGLKYSSEMYAYDLPSDEYLGKGNTWGLKSTYLGAYDGNDKNNTKTYAAAMTIKNDENQNKYVYFPFKVSFEGEYVLKVTYSSRENSDAVVIVDPTTPPTSNNDCDPTVGFGGTKKSNGKWQQIYSASENGYVCPMFTEKYIPVGTLAAGDHNFMFAANENNTENSGCAIRKVTLVSEDMLDKKLLFTETQMFSEAIREDKSKSTSALASNVYDANTYSNNSYADSEKNKTAAAAYVYNNSGSSAHMTFLAASYDSQGKLVGVSAQETKTLLPGEDAYLKTKVDTNGASCLKAFVWDLETVRPIKSVDLFGD